MFSLSPPDVTALELSERLRALRLARNLSQAELAQMAGTSLSSIRRLEGAGQGTLVLLVRVAQALNVAHELDGLFVPNSHSIAQAEALADTRQRASKARGQGKP